ncbi:MULTISPECIES: hypothetical protein [Streptomyces]|uniref:hypothetical protein n=1 Tax=Streptomyces TaxID=1883 RepID=UPI000765F88C|nr:MULTISPECIES: hypothetical protein [Streptomyces]MBE4783966.1 hypothetical protein [Streptomyces caniscabiei]MBE4791535.1 hypothetical protein [Streptomyces caniscabiei]MDX3009228.1 hypothetical protein [Streptomyces caniscabiei]MDX3831336.1 hypothetical protein [Streptomyces europaeiscabiei]
MCIRIAIADALQQIAIWDPDEITILVDRGTHPHDLIRELHDLLAVDLGAPITGAGLTCFCGDPLELPTELTPVPAASGAPTL